MNSVKSEGKKPLLILVAVLVILNAVMCINLTLTYDFVFFLGFMILGIAVSSLIATLGGLPALLISFAIGCLISLILLPFPLTAIKALSPLPFALTFKNVLKNKLGRSSAVAASSAVLTISFCVYFVLYTFSSQGTVTPNAIINTFPNFFRELTEIICTSTTIKVAGELVPSITPEGAVKYLVALIGIFPGIMFFIISIAGYIGAWLYKKTIKLVTGLTLTTQSWKLKAAFPTSVMFILALIVTSLSTSVSPISLASINICIIIFPALFMTGLNSAFEPKIVNGYKFPRLLRPAILFILLLFNVMYFSFACAFFALFDSIKSIIPKRKTEE